MSATVEPVENAHTEHHLSDEVDHPTPRTFIKIAVILALITALETSTYWWPESLHTLALVVLFTMMVIKFAMILLWFMHLKWDNKLFGVLFYIGLILAVGVYAVALLTFHFFAA
jgi:cytochrome c oxidase subunit 4